MKVIRRTESSVFYNEDLQPFTELSFLTSENCVPSDMDETTWVREMTVAMASDDLRQIAKIFIDFADQLDKLPKLEVKS
jgi:hypothetical protein